AMKVLILDDETDFCTLLKMYFDKKGFTTFTATSLVEGLNIIDKEEPDIVFIDNFLPDGEGWETAKAIKYKHPDIQINLMSAKDKSFNYLENHEECIWEKPISMEQLETYIG